MTKGQADKKARLINAAATKLTNEQHRAWIAFRFKMGGGKVDIGDSEALRIAMQAACEAQGVAWPKVAS